jgi:hypothetical protein
MQVFIHPESQDIVARRQVESLQWCATAWQEGRMPGWVFADIVISHRAEAARFEVWPRVCAALIARGFDIFNKRGLLGVV